MSHQTGATSTVFPCQTMLLTNMLRFMTAIQMAYTRIPVVHDRWCRIMRVKITIIGMKEKVGRIGQGSRLTAIVCSMTLVIMQTKCGDQFLGCTHQNYLYIYIHTTRVQELRLLSVSCYHLQALQARLQYKSSFLRHCKFRDQMYKAQTLSLT